MTAQGQKSVWYTSCKIRLQLLIEDFKDDVPIETKLAPKADEAEQGFVQTDLGNGRTRIIFEADDVIGDVVDLTVPEQAEAFQDVGSEAFGIGQEHTVNPYRSIGFDIPAYSCSIERNSYRKADECRVVIPAEKLPIDPRIIRAATIQVFGGTISADEFSRVMTGPGASGILLSDTNVDGTSNELFRGFVDDWDLELSGSDRISISARDLTQFFIDATLPSNAMKNISCTATIDDAMRQIIRGDGLPLSKTKRPGLPGARGIAVVNDTGAQLPRLANIKPPSWFDSKCTVKRGRRKGKKNVQKMSYWDQMTDLCVSSGLICYVRPGIKPVVLPSGKSVPVSAEVVISRPRTYYKKSAANGDEIVFDDTIRKFVYGLNIANLKIRRNYSGASQPKVIEVRSFDEGTGIEYSSRFPLKKKRNRPAVSGKGDREEVQVFVVRSQGGPQTQVVLDSMCRSIYEQLGRGEIEVSFRTKELAFLPRNINPSAPLSSIPTSPLPPQRNADIFQMVSGDPITVTIDKADIEAGRIATFTAFAAETAARRVKGMVNAGIRQDVADEIAKAYQSQSIQLEFRLQRLAMSFSVGEGWSFDVAAINFLDARNAANKGEDAKPSVDIVPKEDQVSVEELGGGITRIVFDDGIDVIGGEGPPLVESL